MAAPKKSAADPNAHAESDPNAHLAAGESLAEADERTEQARAPNPSPAPGTLPGASPPGPDVGELEETIADQQGEIERLREMLANQTQATQMAQQAAAEAAAAAQRAVAAAQRQHEADHEPPLPADAPHPAFDETRPAAQHWGPTGHVGFAQVRGGRTFHYRKDKTPWPDFGK